MVSENFYLLYFTSNTSEIGGLTEGQRASRPAGGAAGALDGLMSICLSVPAVQVGGYSAQQVEIGRHTATPSSQFAAAAAAAAAPAPPQLTRKAECAAGSRALVCGCVLTFQLVFFPLLFSRRHFPLGFSGICLLAKFGTAPTLTKCSLTDTRNTREAMRSDATQACRHWLAIRYAPVVISEIIDFEVSPSIFLFYTL